MKPKATYTGPGLVHGEYVPTPMVPVLRDGKCEWFDGKHVVFGRVLGDGLLVIRKVENVQCGPNNKPRLRA